MTKLVFYLSLLWSTVSLALSFALIPFIGVFGGITVNIISFLPPFILSLVRIWSIYGAGYPFKDFAKIMSSSFVAALLAHFNSVMLGNFWSPIQLLVALLLAAILYLF
ncbi:hypothetical protein HRbin02_00172 [Candidatus Calditenuaceae archaeon HR02]|nr:hypothetical protein HRbin02_00172 [Candidatus Calditenuaceae archaeon HR02]